MESRQFENRNSENGVRYLPWGIVTPILSGLYLSPSVCDSDRTLYFSWGCEAIH